ncbi:MAG: ribosome-binding factor [Kosmotogales bacterium]|jgi:ribosome-binding factor A|nr:ribosome-binding factor [Kosmotogales bacterium]
MSSTYRKEMLESEIKKVLTSALRESRIPKIDPLYVSIVRVTVSKDKRYSNIFVSYFGENAEEKKEEIIEILNENKGYFRTALAKNIRLFKVPEVKFLPDKGIEASIRVQELLNKIHEEDNKN